MKILTIMSSPHRNGNTKILMEEILKGIKDHILIDYSAEDLKLIDYNLTACKGCFDCMEDTYCKHCSDASEIVQKIIESQLVIIGSPIFFFNMTSQLKTLWDHFVMITHPDLKPKLIGKKFAFFTVAGSEYQEIAKSFYIDIEETAKFFQFDILDTMKIGGFWESGSVDKDDAVVDKAYSFGKNILEKAHL